MSRSSKAKDTILPITEDPIQNEGSSNPKRFKDVVSTPTADQVDEEQVAASSDENRARPEDNDCFLKVIDLSFDGRKIEVQGECYSVSKLEAFLETVPRQSQHTIRIILDGRDTSPSYGVWSGDYPSCHGDVHDPFPALDLHPWNMSSALGAFHIPTLRRMWDKNAHPRWCTAKIFAWHTSSCKEIGWSRFTMHAQGPFPYEISETYWGMDHRQSNENKLMCTSKSESGHYAANNRPKCVVLRLGLA
jgi:hypothetical protein